MQTIMLLNSQLLRNNLCTFIVHAAVTFTTAQEFARTLIEQESKGKQKTQSPHHQADVVSYNTILKLTIGDSVVSLD